MSSICPGQKWGEQRESFQALGVPVTGGGGAVWREEEIVISIITVKGCFLSGRLRKKMEKMKNSLIRED